MKIDMRIRFFLVLSLVASLTLFSGCREEGTDSDVPGDGLGVIGADADGFGDADGVGSGDFYEEPHTFRVTKLDIDDSIGVIGSILSGLIETDLRCGILNIVAEYRNYDAEDDSFTIDVGASVVSEDSEDPTDWYCEGDSQGEVPDPDPRDYEFLRENTTARDIPARFVDLDAGTFEVTENFDLTFPAIVPGTQADPEYLLIPLKDVSFDGKIREMSDGRIEIYDATITGAILQEDAEEITVDFEPDDEDPGSTVAELLRSVDQNYPPEADEKTGWMLNVDTAALEVEVDVEAGNPFEQPTAYRVDSLDIDPTDLGVIAQILNGLIETDLRCGVLNVMAYLYGYDAETGEFTVDVGGGAVAESSSDPTAWYCEEDTQASVPIPDPRTYTFLREETTELGVPAVVLDEETGSFETTMSFSLQFPAIVPETQADPEYLLLPLTDVRFSGNLATDPTTGLFELQDGSITGAILKEDADEVVVDLNPNDEDPGGTVSELLSSTEMNYPPDAEEKTGWMLTVDVTAYEAMFDAPAFSTAAE
jgi:hypothetical protein